MKLDDIRKEIDAIDKQLRTLLMKRLDCSAKVAESKYDSGNLTIYRVDREKEIIDTLSRNIPEDRKKEYIAVIKKIIATSRMYQYGLIYDKNPDISALAESCESKSVKVSITIPGSPAGVLSIIGDYGYDIKEINFTSRDTENGLVTFKSEIAGNISDDDMKKLIYHLSEECFEFKITEVIH